MASWAIIDPPESCIAVHPIELAHRLAILRRDSDLGFRCWAQVRDEISETVHRGVRTRYKTLVSEYPFFDPDNDQPGNYFYDQREAESHNAREIIDMLDALARQAQYRRLKPIEISQALRTASAWGLKLKIRFEDFRRLRVYARGEGLERRSRREWFLLYLRRQLSVAVYRQMLIVYEPGSNDTARKSCVYLRMFKNVPHADLDMLLPGSVRINWADSGRIGIPTAWGFAMLVSRLVRNLWLLALFSAVKVLSSLLFVIAVIMAAAVYAFKLFFSYRHAQNRHLLNVTRHLYYQTLSNNSSVLLRLLDELEQQQMCQACLVLHVMETAHPQMKTIGELDRECESLLARLALGAINFDIRSALELLLSMGLVESNDETWRLSGRALEAI